MTSTPAEAGAPAPAWPVWHPGPGVLDLVELVAVGALDRVPPSALVGAPAADVAPTRGWQVEDAEGTVVAGLSADGEVHPLRAFAHPPLRRRRVTPDDLALHDGGTLRPRRAVAVDGPLTLADADHLRAMRGDLIWFVLLGRGRDAPAPRHPLGAGALWRATAAVAAETDPRAVLVPLGLPVGHEGLLPRIAAAYSATGPTMLPAAPAGDLHPAFAAAVRRAVRPPSERGLVVLFTGLSGSGKSTLAGALAERVEESTDRTLTVLDGDVVRRMLSAGLGFGAADRDANVRRIGFVAAEAARHGGLVICAPIAPFAAVRSEVRAMVEAAGGDLVLIHVSTPLAECERRDRKGLYARARRGEIPDFTGISSPYEVPADADLAVDTSTTTPDDASAAVWRLLESRGYLADR